MTIEDTELWGSGGGGGSATTTKDFTLAEALAAKDQVSLKSDGKIEKYSATYGDLGSSESFATSQNRPQNQWPMTSKIVYDDAAGKTYLRTNYFTVLQEFAVNENAVGLGGRLEQSGVSIFGAAGIADYFLGTNASNVGSRSSSWSSLHLYKKNGTGFTSVGSATFYGAGGWVGDSVRLPHLDTASTKYSLVGMIGGNGMQVGLVAIGTDESVTVSSVSSLGTAYDYRNVMMMLNETTKRVAVVWKQNGVGTKVAVVDTTTTTLDKGSAVTSAGDSSDDTNHNIQVAWDEANNRVITCDSDENGFKVGVLDVTDITLSGLTSTTLNNSYAGTKGFMTYSNNFNRFAGINEDEAWIIPIESDKTLHNDAGQELETGGYSYSIPFMGEDPISKALIAAFYKSDSNMHAMAVYVDSSDAPKGIVAPTGFLGILQTAGSADDVRTVDLAKNMQGTLVTGLSGLTPGKDYYTGNFNTLETSGSASKFVGHAVSATELMLLSEPVLSSGGGSSAATYNKNSISLGTSDTTILDVSGEGELLGINFYVSQASSSGRYVRNLKATIDGAAEVTLIDNIFYITNTNGSHSMYLPLPIPFSKSLTIKASVDSTSNFAVNATGVYKKS